MEQEEIINLRDDTHKYSVSWVTIQVVSVPVVTFIRAWIVHRLPGRNGGVPSNLATTTCQIIALSSSEIPSVAQAVDLHETAGGQVNRESTYGVDPITGHSEPQALRQREFIPQWK